MSLNAQGKRCYVNTSVSVSTNSELKALLYAEKKPVYTVLRALEQTGGRGRTGKSFISPKGGLYFSAAYPLCKDTKNISFLTLVSGLAVSKAVKELSNTDTLIKWPNDIYCNNKKLCGILTELISTAFGLCAVVGVGVNLNLTQDNFFDELKTKATSLKMLGSTVPNADELMKKIVNIIDIWVYDQNVLDGNAQFLTKEINSKNFLAGKEVSFCMNGKTVSGTAGNIKDNGGIGIVLPNKKEITVCTGEITYN